MPSEKVLGSLYIYIGIKNTRRTLTFNLRLCASTFLPCLDRTASLTSESSWHSLECSCFTETSTTHTCIIESRKNQPSMAFDTAQATFTRFYLRHDRRSRGLSMKTHNFRLFKHIQTSFMDHKMDNYVTKGSSKRSVAGSAPSTPFRHRLHRPSQEPSRIKLVLPAPEGPKMAPHVTDIQLPKWVSSNTAHESCVVKGHPETPLEKGRFCSTPLPGRYLFLKNKHTHTHISPMCRLHWPPPKKYNTYYGKRNKHGTPVPGANPGVSDTSDTSNILPGTSHGSQAPSCCEVNRESLRWTSATHTSIGSFKRKSTSARHLTRRNGKVESRIPNTAGEVGYCHGTCHGAGTQCGVPHCFTTSALGSVCQSCTASFTRMPKPLVRLNAIACRAHIDSA